MGEGAKRVRAGVAGSETLLVFFDFDEGVARERLEVLVRLWMHDLQAIEAN